MVTNWKTQTIQFTVGKEVVTLIGDPSLSRAGVSLMICTIKKSGGGFLVECIYMGATVCQGVYSPF